MENLQNKRRSGQKLIFYTLTGLILILASLIYENVLIHRYDPGTIVSSMQKDFSRAEAQLKDLVDELSKPEYIRHPWQADTFIREKIKGDFSFHFYFFEKDSLIYWSDNTVPLSSLPENADPQGQVISLPNGFYFMRDTLAGDHRMAAFFLIKRSYPYKNIYLENRYQDAFSASPDVLISLDSGTYNIHSSNGFAFSLQPPDKYEYSTISTLVLLFLYAMAFLAFCAALFHLYLRLAPLLRSKVLLLIAYSIDVLILRALMYIFKVPAGLHDTYVFQPASFAASDLFPSMGDFIFNALTIFVIAYVIFIIYPNIRLREHRSSFRRLFLLFSLFLHIFIFYRLFLWAANSLIMDASYSLNLNQVFFLCPDSFLALFVISLLLFSFFLVSYRILGLAFHYSRRSAVQFFGFLLLASGVYALACILIHDCVFLLFLPLYFYAAVFFIQSYSLPDRSKISFTSVVFYLFLFAILSTAVLSTYNAQREVEQRKLLAIELSSGEDPLSEYIFMTTVDEMEQDTALLRLLSDSPYSIQSEDEAIEYIEDNYLSDRLRKYEWLVTICTPDRNLEIQPQGYFVNCYQYFNELIDDLGQAALGEGQYRYDNEAGMCNYISMSEFIFNNDRDTIKVFIELFSFFIPEEGLGYPEMLIDEEIKTFAGLENYSYAHYTDDKLVFKYGDYPYRTNLKKYGELQAGSFFDHNNYDHYVYRIDENEFLIISKDIAGFLDFLAPFSYLLILYTLFVLIFLAVVNIPFSRFHLELNFRNQLHLYIVSLIIISFVIVGGITVRYVINLNTSKNKEILQEKTHSVLIELEHKLAGEGKLTPDMQDYLTNLLIKFSQVFFSDINLYDLQGNLLASSRPQIFQKQLISAKMNADAYRILTRDKKLLFIQTETIGDQDYFSAYVPFMNQENKVVAYLNLPYFARQTELQNEISVFLNAFLNVYVLMIAVAIFLAILISRYITQPLKLIRDKMGSVSLAGLNEKIDWSGKDEIGTLVAEYNRMIDELARSAELLAKSERESAWREMAKQVAHEIKNPLTPMKLSVQYLQKAWDERSPDWEERLQRFSQTIIEHIETLSAIASEFSDFAKMPQKKEALIDLSEVIRNSLDLFTDTENIRFSFSASTDPPQYVMADKNQLIRVFNNLIKNAVQAIGQDPGGHIDIRLDRIDRDFVISISDNGPGIPDDMVDKIFSPSFTTKSSGMGLGLALVRSIVTEAGGSVSFESKPGKGTVFTVFLPMHEGLE
jgi:signal transduction histidine kinase